LGCTAVTQSLSASSFIPDRRACCRLIFTEDLMDAVARGLAVYVFLLVLFRVSGKRSLGKATTFDFVLLLIIAETTQQALLGNDFSVTNAFLLITTLMGIDIGISLVRRKWRGVDKLIDGTPLIIVDHGQLLEERMRKSRVDTEDVLQAARELRGIERLDQIKYGVLEPNGEISIVPMHR
jgi:uncharacterized membrane protein YcaP (DUF421 family)